MVYAIGLDVGGTKIAGAVYSALGEKLGEEIIPTPKDYESFLHSCKAVVDKLEDSVGGWGTVGIGLPGGIDHEKGTVIAANLPFLKERFFAYDLGKILGRKVNIANDANCMALTEALEGAGKGYKSVLGLILGTGVGSGFIYNEQIVDGPNGFTGEVGHTPFPHYGPEDGPWGVCGCGQKGCIECYISAPALLRLYKATTGKDVLDTAEISALALAKDPDALRVLDHYYELVAKAMSSIIHTLDPYVIVVSGGLSELPNLCAEVPRRWGKYALMKAPKTEFLKATYGPMSGLRGAALLGRD